MSELDYMRKHGAFMIEPATYEKHKEEGWPTPSGKQEFYSQTMIDFGYPEPVSYTHLTLPTTPYV